MADAIIIDTKRCTGCGLCAEVCFLGNLKIGTDGAACEIAGNPCISCGHCAAVCPSNAISLYNDVLQQTAPLSPPADYDSLLARMILRRSRREFTDRPVPRQEIDKLIAAAATAPSAMNKQQVQFTVVTNRDVLHQLSERVFPSIRQLSKMMSTPAGRLLLRLMTRDYYSDIADIASEADALIEAHESGRDVVLYNAPCVILISTPKSDTCGPEDAVYCGANILLTAESIGLGACVIGFVTDSSKRDARIGHIAHVPAGHVIHTTIALGYPKFSYQRPAPKLPPKVSFVD